MSDWHPQETYKGLIQLSGGALRFGALVNGGAAIALLAFMGDLYGSSTEVPSLQGPMSCFIFGIVLAGLAQISAYFTQLALYEESALDKPEDGIYQHRTFLFLSLVLMLGSVGLFCWGAYQATALIAGGACAT